ncbi:transporter substrate-binding domain-containing protein [Ochrobactrum chromiisoli]|uniref:Transporter substrate-binding domain-containing protein n=1 Tax=Ochrobactrum chromiisoli TaxID=2993941 RepID=A0ABT3QSJ3_9HYPH|nr:transporter substrate-binding domain-containing protein [Ochrobactrum chromiisoli]MCX2698583.1 transporter substrate-binding domain-containing protein [Ochrobactrum chromiisoli]
MKRRMFLAALVATTVAFAQASYAQEKTLVVGTDIEAKPFDFAQDGKYIGFDQDLLAEIAKEVGFKYTVNPMDFGALIPALQTANIDLAISSIFMTDARKKVVDFSDVYFTSALGVLIDSDDATIKSGGDLAGKKVASVTGAASTAWLKENVPTAQVTLFPQFSNMVMELRAGRAEAVVYDYPYLAYYAKTEGGDEVKLLDKPVGDGIPVGIAFPKGSDLVAPTNEALKKIKADGRYDEIYKKWFGSLPQN